MKRQSCVLRNLGTHGVDWIVVSLTAGAAMSAYFRGRWADLYAGSVDTFLPEGVDARDSYAFRSGFAATPETMKMASEATIARVLARFPAGTLIVEDDMARDSDFRGHLTSRQFSSGGRLFHWTSLNGLTVEAVAQFLDLSTSGYPLNAFVFDHLDSAHLSAVDVPASDVQALAARARALIIGAYDAASYVVWMPQLR